MGKLYLRYLTQCLLSGVEWLPSANYLDATKTEDGSIVRLNVGPTLRSIKTRFLIAGDGVCSRVATDLQLDTNREWIVGVENVYDNVKLDSPPRLLCFLDPRIAPGYIAWIAYDGEDAHVGVGGYSRQFDPVSALQEFEASVIDLVDLRDARRVERRGGRIPVGGVLKSIANKQGLLIGDAAGAVSPLTAGGLDPCMRLSTLAASVTAEYLSTTNPEILTQYSGELFRQKFTSRLWARRVAAHLQSPLVAEVACAAFRLPLVKTLAAKVFFGRGSFPDVQSEIIVERADPLGTH
jgi:flavin-dependent dehydrogenase